MNIVKVDKRKNSLKPQQIQCMYRILIHKALISSANREIYHCINFTHGDVKLTAKKGDDWANH